ncbi:MAG TPA: response regulator [Gemmatimonadales bacterium]|nr:response regulator [Gemmatimonadales bacterium]
MPPPPDARRILVVEDETLLRNLTTRFLQQSGYSTLNAADGEEALELLEREGGLIDLVVTDLKMPRLGGIGLYRATRRRGMLVPMLFTSAGGSAEGDDPWPADVSGRFLPKPWELEDLLSAVRQVLGEV